MHIKVLYSTKINGIEHEDYALELRSFIAENNIPYFYTTINILKFDSTTIETKPIHSWSDSKIIYNGILKNIGEYLKLSDSEKYRLSKEIGI